MRLLQLGAICLLLAAKPIVSFNPGNLFGISRQQEPQMVVQPPETYEEFLARYEDGCPVHKFGRVRILSHRPEIMLIDGFLSEREAEAILHLAYAHIKIFELIPGREPLFQQSTIVGATDYYEQDTSWRSSYTAFLPKPDGKPEFNIVRCIEKRAAEFQGYIPLQNMEDLQVVRYHYNWEPQRANQIKVPQDPAISRTLRLAS